MSEHLGELEPLYKKSSTYNSLLTAKFHSEYLLGSFGNLQTAIIFLLLWATTPGTPLKMATHASTWHLKMSSWLFLHTQSEAQTMDTYISEVANFDSGVNFYILWKLARFLGDLCNFFDVFFKTTADSLHSWSPVGFTTRNSTASSY